MIMDDHDVNVNALLGKTLTAIEKIPDNNKRATDELVFTCSDGSRYRMWHDQDCCERVAIEDICGDLNDLIGSPLTMAEEVSNEPPADYQYADDSHTWTFYKFATVKGYVTLRWLGESNGYYSESVRFAAL